MCWLFIVILNLSFIVILNLSRRLGFSSLIKYTALPIVYIETKRNIYPYFGTTVHIKGGKLLFEWDKRLLLGV